MFERLRKRVTGAGQTFGRVMKDGGPGFCHFAITDACNAGCEFCNFRVGEIPASQLTYAPLEQTLAALDHLAANGVAYVAFAGGEPTLHPGLAQMLARAKGNDMTTLVVTNGSTLRPERVREYAQAGMDSAVISIDAPSVNAHEANRKLPGVCRRIADANSVLAEAGIPATASVTISKLLGDLAELPGFLRSLGFRQVSFSYPLRSLPSTFRGFADSDLVTYSPEELCEVFDGIKKLKKGFRVVNPTASLSEMQRFLRGEKQRFPCLAGCKYFHLDWNMDLYRCQAWPKPMCSVMDFEPSKLVRDGCTCCMIDCYRDASVLHYVGMAVHDAARDLSERRPLDALRKLLNRSTLESVKSVLENANWTGGLRRR